MGRESNGTGGAGRIALMGSRDACVDAYIAKSADFAKPILERIRQTVHQACPEVQEAMKWSAPHFMYHGMLCGMASFKEHCALGFWKGALLFPGEARGGEAMGQFGRITRVTELPAKPVLIRYIRQAMKLNEDGIRIARPKPKAKPRLAAPADLKRAFERNSKARAAFQGFSPSHQRKRST
jgi:hypothetical protein